MRITKDDKEWCTDCTVTILVDVESEGIYHVKAKSNIGETALYNSKKVDDVAYYGEEVCYPYYI